MKNNFRITLPYSHVLTLAEEKEISLSAALALLRARGIHCVDIDTDGDRREAAALTAALREAELSVGAVYGFLDAGEGKDGARRALERAALLGAEALVLLPLSQMDAARFFSGCAEIAKEAAATGISLLVGNLARASSLLATPSDAEELFRSVGGAWLSFDTAAYFLRDVNTVAFFQEVAPKVRRIVLSDLLPDEQTYGDVPMAVDGDTYYYPAPVGAGVFPMKTLRHVLKDCLFAGDVSLSLYGVKSMEAAITASLAFLEQFE